ncbi:autism susceptibility gene 2 protein isoform X8 [Melanotaenia boesemani]|uniref:autism susceptibility gene 2 protein isoform X8 n=1 Tax=Melanotaenia boesemani TaxID=1250792 RepID=UPI001C03D20B|nr:autism susceptibility gene 2 protein isoform X8 [Melanotaenia boesemani]
MDGKLKQGRRCRSKRERVRRLREAGSRDARSPDPNSSCSDREGHSPGRDTASLPGKKAPHPAAAARTPRPPRRKRRESSSQEEDIIDGFAITSFISLDCLEKKSGIVKTQEKKERWKEKKVVKRQKKEDEEVQEEEENVQPVVDPLENGFLHHAQREQERMNERLLKKTYSKKNKTIKPLALRPVKVSEDETLQELSRPHRSNSKEQLSESSTHSLSGRGYSVQPAAVALLKCDSESDIDDKVSDVGSEKLFSPTTPKGVPTNESPESKTCTSAKVSGLQRSQEQSNTEVPFAPPVPSPTPASAPTGSPAPAAAAAPPDPPRFCLPTPPPLSVKKEQQPPPPVPTPPLLKASPHPQPHPPHPLSHQEPRVFPPLPHHTRPVISHQVHHPLQYNSLHDISHSSSPVGLPKQHLPPSPHHHLSGLPSTAPALPLSIANLSTSHYSSLRSPAHRHSAMFATPATLPPPPTLPANSLVVPGHPAGTPYPEHDLLRQELNNRFLVQSSERGRGPSASPLAPVSLLRAEFHQHQHMHQHQHTHQHTFTPFPASLPPAAILTPPTAPPMVRTQARNFDKYTPKLDNPFIRHSNFFPSYPPTMPGMPPLLPHSGPFSSLQGAFQPKASNPIDVAARPGAVPHTLLQKDPRISDPFRTSVRKPGKWCAVHVQIAWQIYHHQQKMKQMQLDPHKLDMNGKLDLFSRPPAPGVFPGFPYPHDLARPLFPSTGPGHPAPSPYGPAPHPSGFLPPSHLAGKYPFSRSSSFGGLGNLSSSAFGGLGNPSLGSNSMFGSKEGPGGLPTFGSPHQDTWNRLRRTPPSFPTPPQWPKTTDIERSSSANSHERERDRERDREREREREKRDSSVGKEEKDKDRDSVDRNRHSNRSSPASAPVSYQISSLIRSNSQNSNDSGRHHSGSVDRVREAEKELLERHRESSTLADVKVKESRSPGKEMLERRMSEDCLKPAQRSPSPYSKVVINEQGMKMSGGPPPTMKDSERKELPSAELLHKVKNDMKIKEERKEEQEVMVVSSEPPPPPQVQSLSVPVNQPGNPHHHHPPLSQQPPLPSPRGSDIPAPGLQGVPMAHSLPLSMSAMPQMGSLNVLDRARMAPFMGVSPLAGRERLPHTAFPWDPLREAYRSLDLQRRMDFQLRAEQGHRFPNVYEQERVYREREAHDYSHHEHLLEVRREHERMRQQAEERERLHLREELDRARLHQLHQSPIEGHLPHMPPFMPHLGGMPYPRLSPSTGHNGHLNRTPPTAALSAPPPLVPASSARPTSPRRTTPLTTTQDPRDYSPSRNPKEVEAR